MASNLVPIRPQQQPSSNVLTMGLSRVRRMSMPNGDRGTEFTIARIRELIHAGMTDQLINRQAMAIVHAAGVQPFDFVGEIRAIFDWVRRNVRFFKDIDGVETLRTAREVLTIRGGDCDDITVLLSSLLLTIGHGVRLVTISSDADAPGVFSHIYCEVEIGGQWVPLDAARRDPAFGKGPRQYFRKRIWSLTDNNYRDVSGLGGYFSLPRSRNGRMRRLGDFTDILDSLAPVIASGGTAAAQIITATNSGIRPSVPGFAVNPATGQLVPVGPNGQLMVSSAPGGIVTSASGSIPNWMLWGGGLLGAVLLLKTVGR
jgi:transglutaminase superfamily protein